MILSGMSNMEQMVDNVETFETHQPLTQGETQLLLDLAEGMKDSIPCTGCRYCCDGCPMGLDIPMLIATLNELRFSPVLNTAMRLDALPPEKLPSACIQCGSCVKICPQGIDVPKALSELTDCISQMPTWAEICRQRAAAQKKD